MGHVKGQIAQDPHPGVGRLTLQQPPLPFAAPLQQGLFEKVVGPAPLQETQGAGMALGERAGPLPPGPPPMDAAQHHEAAVIAQPGRLGPLPDPESLLQRRGLLRPADPQGHTEGRCPLNGQTQIEHIAPIVRTGKPVAIGGAEPALGHQVVDIDQPGVEGRAAGGAVGRAGAVGGGEGQQLPNANAMAT